MQQEVSNLCGRCMCWRHETQMRCAHALPMTGRFRSCVFRACFWSIDAGWQGLLRSDREAVEARVSQHGCHFQIRPVISRRCREG